jgi:hypothetical protein
MGWPSDQKLATFMLEQRTRGVRFGDFLRRSAKGYTQFFVIMGAGTAAFAWLESEYDSPVPLTAIIISVACGSLLRDIGWFRLLRRQWPFRERTTDWNEVQKIADGA